MHKHHILIVDDHPLFRKAIIEVLEEQPYIKSVHEVSDGSHCLKAIRDFNIDVVLLDINMPGQDGLETIKEIRAQDIDVTVIILTQFDDRKFYTAMEALGADGYLLKSTTEEEFLAALEAILHDHQRVITKPATQNTPSILGERESQVLSLICQQLSSEQIAEQLSISVHTVGNHRKKIMKKIGTNTVAGMVKWAMENGIA